jgi:hypothetical protein
MKHKIIFLPHANLQYSQLKPSKRKWVIKESYEKMFDLVLKHSDYKIAFEASGVTLQIMQEEAPEVMTKLKKAIKEGKIEPVASPYTHVMMSNINPDLALKTLVDGLDAWEKLTGVRPTSGWNPECSWTNHIADLYKEAGFKRLILDADSLFLSFDEIRNATGLSYDVRSHSNKNKLFLIEDYIKDKPEYLKYLTNPSVAKNGLQLICRSDMMANPMLWFLMGATEGHRDKPISIEEVNTMLESWRYRIENSGTFIMPYAEDAEYIGTSAYFYVKQFNEARFFEPVPSSIERFTALLDAALDEGYELSTPTEVTSSAKEIIPNEQLEQIDNGIAWHGGTAKAWANTPYSRIMDPVCRDLLNGLENINNQLGFKFPDEDPILKEARITLTNAYVSDSRWPPAPTSPGRFNVQETIHDLYATNKLLKEAMIKHNIQNLKSLHSFELMNSLIKSIEDELMNFSYFGEK